MKLDYGTQLSYAPIKLSFGAIRKPTLADIAEVTFNKFEQYESLTKLTPKDFLSQITVESGEKFWDIMNEEEKEKISMFDLIVINDFLRNQYMEMLNFFFVEEVIFKEEKFVILSGKDGSEIGAIDKDAFNESIEIIEQICCINGGGSKEEKPKFKNKRAQKIYEKINSAPKQKKIDFDHTIPNLISAVSAMHNSINIVNVWQLTIFQLIDQFNRIHGNIVYDIECTRVSVWGDEKNKFNLSAWYKNQFDK